MKGTSQNIIHIDRMWGLFVGHFDDNVLHKHYALQISIASNTPFQIIDEQKKSTSYTACFINSNVKHQIKSEETSLIILINPISSIGHQLFNKYRSTQIDRLNSDFEELSIAFNNYLNHKLTFAHFIERVNSALNHFNCNCEHESHFTDDRIYKAVQYLEQHIDRVVSLKEIADVSFISQSRFLHLFKEKTNLNFRRYQLWNKLIKSLPYLKTNSITETAHQFGFTDSSHYSRTFKETFGLSLKSLTSVK